MIVISVFVLLPAYYKFLLWCYIAFCVSTPFCFHKSFKSPSIEWSWRTKTVRICWTFFCTAGGLLRIPIKLAFLVNAWIASRVSSTSQKKIFGVFSAQMRTTQCLWTVQVLRHGLQYLKNGSKDVIFSSVKMILVRDTKICYITIGSMIKVSGRRLHFSAAR